MKNFQDEAFTLDLRFLTEQTKIIDDMYRIKIEVEWLAKEYEELDKKKDGLMSDYIGMTNSDGALKQFIR